MTFGLDPTIPLGRFCVVVMRHGPASGAGTKALGRVASRYEGARQGWTCFFLAHTAQADVAKHVIAPGPEDIGHCRADFEQRVALSRLAFVSLTRQGEQRNLPGSL